MPENKPSLDEWRALYEAAIRFKELAPWQWMEELDIFGILNPESGEIGFASIMGMAGEHFAMSLYLGTDGLYGDWELEHVAPFFDAETFFRIPQLQASFEDRTERVG